MAPTTTARLVELLGERANLDHAVGALTTYRVGGRAAAFVEVASPADLEAVSRAVADTGTEVFVLGKGSNVIVADGGFSGLVVQLTDAYAGIDFAEDGVTVSVGGATAYPVLARQSAAAGLTGLEWAVGIPGSVGGAVRMNAGGHGAETAEVLVTADLVSLVLGERRTLPAEELSLSYRHSSIRADEIVVGASYRLFPGDRGESEARIGEIVRWRRANQPGGQNAGSVFTNPPGDSAGRLIEESGLKGHRLGSAAVSDKHANFIQADPGGSADDILRLIDVVRSAVADRTGVELSTEVRVLGVVL